MKRLIFISIFAVSVVALQAKKSENIFIEEAVNVVDCEPQFKGEDFDKFMFWVRDNIRITNDVFRAGLSAEAHVEFVVEKDGSISNIEVRNETFDGLVRQVSRRLKRARKLTPAAKNGAPVRYKTSFVVGWDIDANSVAYSKRYSDAVERYDQVCYQRIVPSYSSPNVRYSDPESVSLVVRNTMSNSLDRARTGYLRCTPRFSPVSKSEKIIYTPYAKRPNDPTNGSYPYAAEHTHTYLTVGAVPQMVDGGSYVEFLDWLFEGLNNIKGYDFAKRGYPFSRIIHQKDGTQTFVLSASLGNDAHRSIDSLLSCAPKFTPATLDGEPVKYQFKFENQKGMDSRDIAKMWMQKSFSDDMQSLIKIDYPINAIYADKLPSYNNRSLYSYKRAIITLAAKELAKVGKPINGHVNLRIIVCKDGRVGKVDVVWQRDDEDFAKAIASAYGQLPDDLWTPAEVGGRVVDSVIWL